ncbi:MAG: phospholipase C [Phycisphaerae bacterium]
MKIAIPALLSLLIPAMAARGASPTLTPIKRVIIIYQENRSFDHYYGTFPGVNGILSPDGQIKPELMGLQVDGQGIPFDTTSNPMPGFQAIPPGLANEPFHLSTYYPSSVKTADPTHGFDTMRTQAGWTSNGPQLGPFPMNRFVSAGNTGPLTISHYSQADIPRYWSLATEWTLADNYFPAAWGPSQLNYQYLIAGRPMATTDGKLDQVTGSGRPAQTHRNIGDLMNDAGVSWAWYVGPGDEDIPTFDGGPFKYFANAQNDPAYQAEHFRKFSQLLSDIANDTLPSVCFIQTWCFSEHAGFGSCNEPVFNCQDFVADLVVTLQGSGAWKDAAILITYDEGGGFWDHASPPQYIDVIEGQTYDGTVHADGLFYPVIGDGVRIPLLVISPFAKRGQIARGQYDACSITRFIEDNWSLSRLNAGTTDVTRDVQVAALNAFCDVFNFPGMLSPPPDLNGQDISVFLDVLLGLDTDPNHICFADMDNNSLVDDGDVPLFVGAVLAG